MSCEFISELRRLSKLSAEAVQNLDHFYPLKKYMHITRHTEIDFKQLLLKIAEVNHKCWRREIATIFCREYLTNFCRKSRSQQNK